jgi:hypothetical protein
MAGILPYAKQVINNKKHIYFLFSRETLDNKKLITKGCGVILEVQKKKEKPF